MRKRVLLLALTSMLMLFCIPLIAQQSQADSTVRLIDLTADMIANVKAYEPGPMKIQKNEYIIEIGTLSKKSKSDNKLNKDKTSRVPVGTTVKELLSKLPGVEYAKDGKMITKTGKAVITDIVFDHTLVYSTDQIAVNKGDRKLKEGTVFLRIIDQEYYDNSHRVVLEDRNAPSPGTAFIRLTYYPGKDAGQVSGIEEIYPEWWEGILVEKVYDVNTGKQVITTMPEHHYTGMENGHGYVDLGLSTMWATCNVGADNPVQYGDYFAWGETEPYYKPGYARAQETKWKKGKERGYSWSSYSYCEGSESTMTKYCVSSKLGQVDNKHILEQADDAASVNWGGEWRMPSAAEVSELTNLDNTIWTWYGIGNSEFGGVAGFKVQSRKPGYTDNYIFLPAAGQYLGEEFSFAGFDGSYWYNTLYGFEFCYSFSAGVFGLDEEPDNSRGFTTREMGCSVRPVCRKTDVPTPEARPMPSGTDMTFTPNTPKVKPGTPMPVDIPGLDIDVDSNGIKHIMALPEDYYSNKENGYAYVDLGLSVKWATCNMGADEPYVAGDLYAWGETTTKSEYTWENYKFYNGMEDGWKVQLSKYNLSRDLGRVDKRTVLQRSDDAAHVNRGGKWRLPTRDECNELIDNCTFVWASMNGVFGYIVISNKPGYTDRFIFLPINTTTDQGYGIIQMCSYYWSSNLNEVIRDVGDYPGSIEAYAMYILKLGEMYDVWKDQKIERRYNQPIRPVCE